MSESATRAASAFPSRQSRESEAASEDFASGPLATRETGRQHKRVGETTAWAVIHNPADRKKLDYVTSYRGTAKRFPPRLRSGNFCFPRPELADARNGSEGATGNSQSSGAER